LEKIILLYLDIVYEFNPIRCLDIRHPFLVAVQLSLIIKKSLLESEFFYFFLDPIRELEELHFVHLCALPVQLAVVQLHHCVKILVVHFKRKETHLEKFLIRILPDANVVQTRR
jgi:hypothetical protein